MYLLVVWGFFRLLIRFPEAIEELWFKPLIWLVPVVGIWLSQKKRVKIFEGNFKRAILYGLGLGVIWLVVGIATSLGRFGAISFLNREMNYLDILGAAVATAAVEELVFSGFIFQTILKEVKNEFSAILTSAVMFALIHIPIGLFIYKYSAGQMIGFLVVLGMVAGANFFAMARTRNVVAPILSHWLWTVVMVVIN